MKSNSPYTDEKLDAIPAGIPAAIQHVLYIVKENRTYDQVLGDIGKGESDPSLCLFEENVSPNHHKLAREFVLFDNFYVNSDVSADGHNWSTSAIANDYVEKMWPSNYAQRATTITISKAASRRRIRPPAICGPMPRRRGVSMRNYGYWVENKNEPGADGVQIDKVLDPVLAQSHQHEVSQLRPRLSGREARANISGRSGAIREHRNQMPALMIMRLGNDHTSGTAPGKIAPLSSFADNDYALGMIVEGVSRSKFWGSTAIFVLEDDAQNGPDHVDSHRSPAFLISPYTRRGTIDSTHVQHHVDAADHGADPASCGP